MEPMGSGQVRVAVQAADPISHAGLTGYLRRRPELVVVPATRPEDADVVILAPARLSVSVLADMRRAAKRYPTPVVLIVDTIGEADWLAVIECRVVTVLRRAMATGERLLYSVLAAASGGDVLPPELLGALLRHVTGLRRDILAPHGLDSVGLSAREIDVLRLLADGVDTVEVARHYAVRGARSRPLSSATPPD